jgi:predicted PurR-regulated permease PerM
VDNFLKPILIGEKTRIPTLFLFLAILGGMTYYGLIGVFLGPAMLALFLTLIDIYRKDYSQPSNAERS